MQWEESVRLFVVSLAVCHKLMFVFFNPHFKRGLDQSVLCRSCALLFVNNRNMKTCVLLGNVSLHLRAQVRV